MGQPILACILARHSPWRRLRSVIYRHCVSPFKSLQLIWRSDHLLMPDLPMNYSLQWRHNDHDMASQITGVPIVCSIVCSGADQRKHQSSASLAFVMGIHWWLVDSPHKWPLTRKMFTFYDVIMLQFGENDRVAVYYWLTRDDHTDQRSPVGGLYFANAHEISRFYIKPWTI